MSTTRPHVGVLALQGDVREHVAVLVQERERQLFARLVERNEGPLSEAMLRHIFQEIINTLKSLQRPEKDSSEAPERRVS